MIAQGSFEGFGDFQTCFSFDSAHIDFDLPVWEDGQFYLLNIDLRILTPFAEATNEFYQPRPFLPPDKNPVLPAFVGRRDKHSAG